MTALSHLRELNSFTMDASQLTQQSINKINSTTEYSLRNRTGQNRSQVITRCTIATMAEQEVARHMNGYVMDSVIDFDDPFTYAFDVLSGVEYYGSRIEVKTHQSNARWISVNLDERNVSGHMNLFHFLNYDVADYITIFDSKPIAHNVYNFKCVFAGTKANLRSVIRKSNYNGWYLHI